MSISVIIPTLNEQDYIGDCLKSLLIGLKDFKDYEIIIVDGDSNDDTVKIVNQFCKTNQKIRILTNPKKIAPAALNIGIESSNYEVIIRCDAHAYYPPDYIKNNINLLKISDKKTMNVGGYVITKSKHDNIISQSIAYVLSSTFGVGNSVFRTGNKKEKKYFETDTVPFGCFKKEIFNIIGNFNENEPGNEDLEFNHRIKKSGYKIMISDTIYSYYHSRPDVKKFLKQTINNGIITTHNKDFSFRSWRHYVPLFFSIFLIAGITNSLIFNHKLIAILFNLGIILYAIFITIGTINVFLNKKKFLFLFIGPLIFFLLHFFYGLGSILGFFKFTKSTKMFSYNQFLETAFPIKNPFKRKDHGLFHNTLKLIALKISYICYRLKISANLLDRFGFVLVILSFVLINYQFLFFQKRYDLLILGYLIIGIILFIDFVDGQLARVEKKKFIFGNDIDDFNPSLIRIFLIIYPGILSENFYILLFSVLSAATFTLLYGQTYKSFALSYPHYTKIVKCFFGIRFLYLLLFPLLTLINLFFFDYNFMILVCVTGIHFIIALGYYYLCSIITE